MIIERIQKEAPSGTVIPKPSAKNPFRVKGMGIRRGQRALIYTIPNNRDPNYPYEKGITVKEFETAYKQLISTGELTHKWFSRHLIKCASEGSCNFTTIGGLLEYIGLASYAGRGVYRKVGNSYTMLKIITAIFLLIQTGCMSLSSDMPGSINEYVSGFDQTIETSMEPAWLISKGGTAIKFGLYKTSKMEEDKAILIAVVKGTFNFSDTESLWFNIDGEQLSFESIDSLTEIETKEGFYNSAISIPAYNESSKRYWISKDFIKKLIDAKEVWVKIVLSKGYAEGEFSKDDPYLARPAFKQFYYKIWGNGI